MDRVMKDVVAPPMWPLGKDKLWDKKGTKHAATQQRGDTENHKETPANNQSAETTRTDRTDARALPVVAL